MGLIPLRLRDAVVARAGNRCEYCQLSQLGQEATFHVDHVQPRAAGGGTRLDNLACVSSWDGPRVVAHTATGRASVAALALNRALIVAIREAASRLGRHPPSGVSVT